MKQRQEHNKPTSALPPNKGRYTYIYEVVLIKSKNLAAIARQRDLRVPCNLFPCAGKHSCECMTVLNDQYGASREKMALFYVWKSTGFGFPAPGFLQPISLIAPSPLQSTFWWWQPRNRRHRAALLTSKGRVTPENDASMLRSWTAVSPVQAEQSCRS